MKHKWMIPPKIMPKGLTKREVFFWKPYRWDREAENKRLAKETASIHARALNIAFTQWIMRNRTTPVDPAEREA